MSIPTELVEQGSAERPAVRELAVGPDGRSFRLSFEPGQALPPHQNPKSVVIFVETGGGLLFLDDQPPRQLETGTRVRLDPNARHAVVAGQQGLELRVTLAVDCCENCG